MARLAGLLDTTGVMANARGATSEHTPVVALKQIYGLRREAGPPHFQIIYTVPHKMVAGSPDRVQLMWLAEPSSGRVLIARAFSPADELKGPPTITADFGLGFVVRAEPGPCARAGRTRAFDPLTTARAAGGRRDRRAVSLLQRARAVEGRAVRPVRRGGGPFHVRRARHRAAPPTPIGLGGTGEEAVLAEGVRRGQAEPGGGRRGDSAEGHALCQLGAAAPAHGVSVGCVSRLELPRRSGSLRCCNVHVNRHRSRHCSANYGSWRERDSAAMACRRRSYLRARTVINIITRASRSRPDVWSLSVAVGAVVISMNSCIRVSRHAGLGIARSVYA